MQTIKAAHWTADFQLGRFLYQAYQESGFAKIAILCLGDPRTPEDYLAHFVADELRRYHPKVFGTSSDPIHADTLDAALTRHQLVWENAFMAVVAATAGKDNFGVILADQGGEAVPPSWHGPNRSGEGDLPHDPSGADDPQAVSGKDEQEEQLVLFPDARVYGVTVLPGERGADVLADRKRRAQVERCGNAIIDGFLRFFHKMGYDHTVGEQD